MNQQSHVGKKSDSQSYHFLLIILIFIAGLLNSQHYLEFMGLNRMYIVILLAFYCLLGFWGIITFVNYLKRNKNYPFPYWMILIIGVSLKFILLFIQFPYLFLPGEKYFYQLITYTVNFMLMIVLARNIHSIKSIKRVILSFGLGASFSAIIPFIFFPEMIGTRETYLSGYKFVGSFWNPTVISLMSVGWLLIALIPTEKLKRRKNLLIGIFILLLLGGLSGLSRSTLLAISLSVIVYLIASNKLIQYLKSGILIIACFLIIGLIFPEVVESFQQRLEASDIKEEPRTAIWIDYIEDIPKFLLFGALDGDHIKYSTSGHSPHSVLLNWLAQYGLISLIGFVLLLLGVFRSIRNIRKSMSKHIAASLYAWLSCYLSIALINETGFNELTIYGAFGIIIAWGNIENIKRYEN